MCGELGVFVPNDAPAGVAVEDPLCGVVGIGFGETVGVAFGGDLGPVVEVEGDFDESGVGDIQLLVEFANRHGIFGRGAEGPDGREVVWGKGDNRCRIVVEQVSPVNGHRNSSHLPYRNTLEAPSLASSGMALPPDKLP